MSCALEVSEKGQTRSLHSKFQILTPGRASGGYFGHLRCDTYEYDIEGFGNSISSVWAKLIGVGFAMSTYSVHHGRTDEDFSVVLSDIHIGILDGAFSIEGDFNVEIYDHVSEKARRRFGALPQGQAGTECDEALLAVMQ